MPVARKASSCVANAFLARLKLVWPRCSLNTTKMSIKRIFFAKSSRSQWVKTGLPSSSSDHSLFQTVKEFYNLSVSLPSNNKLKKIWFLVYKLILLCHCPNAHIPQSQASSPCFNPNDKKVNPKEQTGEYLN